MDAAELKKKRTFRKFSYRGVDLEQLLDLSSEQVIFFLSLFLFSFRISRQKTFFFVLLPSSLLF